jgi:6-phosphofructokinase
VRTYTNHMFMSQNIESALAPGYPTAVFNMAQAAKKLRTTASTTKRVFTLESMGRDAGWLALAASYGGAEVVLIPEYGISADVETRLYDRVASQYRVSRHCVVCVSEGTNFNGLQSKQAQYGSRKLGGAGDIVAKGGELCDGDGKPLRTVKGIESGLKDRNVLYIYHPNGYEDVEAFQIVITPEVRSQRTDYTPRMGSPSEYDLRLADVLGNRLRVMLREGQFGHLPVLSEIVPYEELTIGNTKPLPMAKVEQMLLPVKDYYNTTLLTAKPAFLDLVSRILTENEKSQLHSLHNT